MNQEIVNVLLVDDNIVDVEVVRRAFRRNRIANPIIVAQDGLEALEKLNSGEVAHPFLVLLDLNMPRMNGLEFLSELRANPEFKDTIVFVLTTSDNDEDKRASYRHNVAGYIVKSSVGTKFMEMVSMLDCFWKVVAFPPKAKNVP